jgi:hypothetical protein
MLLTVIFAPLSAALPVLLIVKSAFRLLAAAAQLGTLFAKTHAALLKGWDHAVATVCLIGLTVVEDTAESALSFPLLSTARIL